ncbi:MAG: sensor histidine kinase [Novosphingobium sp.]
MFAKRSLPLAGIVLALIAGALMLASGSSVWLTLGVIVLWLGTLWLSTPEPQVFDARVDAREVSRDAIHEVIEPVGHPLLLLDGNRVVEANAAARTALGEHILGQDARIALRYPEAVRLVDMTNGASVNVPGLTGPRSVWQLTRRGLTGQRWIIEMADRTAESDMGRAHTDFVANASHELRTPLASIIGYAETLGDTDAPSDPETRGRFIGIIDREARRMLSLVEDLMTLSHVEAEKHERPSERIDLSQLAARVVAEVSSLRGKERVSLALADPSTMILADPSQLEQLLRNLVDNALKYGADDQPVTVAVTAQDGKARLVVTDRGPGIPPHHLPHLTRRFYRTDPGRSRASGGTGLGLAIVKHIVERHGGTLDFASVVGHGTEVTVQLPLVSSERG